MKQITSVLADAEESSFIRVDTTSEIALLTQDWVLTAHGFGEEMSQNGK